MDLVVCGSTANRRKCTISGTWRFAACVCHGSPIPSQTKGNRLRDASSKHFKQVVCQVILPKVAAQKLGFARRRVGSSPKRRDCHGRTLGFLGSANAYIYIQKNKQRNIHTYVHTYVYTYILTYLLTALHTHIHAHANMHIYTHKDICVYIYRGLDVQIVHI